MNQHYRIKLKKDQIEIEVESTAKEFVEGKIVELMEEFIAKTERDLIHSARGATGSVKKESLMEFLKRVNPKSATDYAVSIAYHLERVDGIEEITVKHIKEGFKRAKFRHSNASQVLVDAKAKSLFMDGSAPKRYTLTQSGEKWVEDRIQATT